MEFLFWFFGVFCLAYYGVIVCYSGPSTSFAPIWLVLSACLFIIATVVHFYDRFRDRISLRAGKWSQGTGPGLGLIHRFTWAR